MQDIVVWGTGSLAKRFIEQKGNDYQITCLVEGDQQREKVSHIRDIPVHSKEEYFASNKKALPLFICSTYFIEICIDLQAQKIPFDSTKIVFSGDDVVHPKWVDELDPSLDTYMAGHKHCREFYQKLAGDPNVATFEKSPRARMDLLAYAFSKANIAGLNLEFGVLRGDSLCHLASQSQQQFWGFDSFEGLPERWVSGYEKGLFDIEGELPQVPDNVSLIKGWFNETLPGFIASHTKPISFLHMDADLYSSTIYVLNALVKQIVPGTVIVFDEYNYYFDPTFAEKKAFLEFVEKYQVEFEYFAQMEHSVAVKILKLHTGEPDEQA